MSPEEATDCALVMLLKGLAWVPELLSLPVGATNQLAAQRGSEVSATKGNKLRHRLRAEGRAREFFMCWGDGLDVTGKRIRNHHSAKHGSPRTGEAMR